MAKAETIESDVAPCQNCAKVLISVGWLCFGLVFFLVTNNFISVFQFSSYKIGIIMALFPAFPCLIIDDSILFGG